VTTTATASSDVGTYPIAASGLTSNNYDITFVAGTLTITKAPLTVTADDKSKVYGAALPTFTVSYSGFVLGQDESVLGGTLSVTTTATASSDVGTYPIAASGLTSNNYDITFVAGTLTITAAVPPAYVGYGEPIYYTRADIFGTSASFRIDYDGTVLQKIEASSQDGKLTLTINQSTIARDKNGNLLSSLTAAVNVSPPPPPAGASIIGLAYNFGPVGATFNPPATFKYTYSQDTIPQGIAEEGLVVAYYDEQAGKWIELPSTVDPVSNTIVASVSHFTTFAVIGTPKPAAFRLTLVGISPAEVGPGETVTISVSVANSGGIEGSHTVVLQINGAKEAEKTITVAAGKSQVVTFTVVKSQVGSYKVTVDGLEGSFTVVAPPLAPAAFSLSNLSIQPTQVQPNQTVTITASVANSGGIEGSHTVVLQINGEKEAERTITVAAGKSQVVTFTLVKEKAGSYTVALDGLIGRFTVVAPPETPALPTPPITPPAKPAFNWPLIGGIIGAVVVVGLVIFFLIRRRAY
jgi:hypothetical protein